MSGKVSKGDSSDGDQEVRRWDGGLLCSLCAEPGVVARSLSEAALFLIGQSHKVPCDRPVVPPQPSQGTAAIMHCTGWQCIPKATHFCPKSFQWLHLPWLNRSEDMIKHKACGASWPLKESHQTKLRECITWDLGREQVVFRSSTEHRLQAHPLATTVSTMTTDGNGRTDENRATPYSQSSSQDMHPVSTFKSREAGAQNFRLHWLHPAAALLTYIH